MEKSAKYISALSLGWLMPFYDPFLKWGMREETFKHQLIQQADIQAGMRVLDLGCGTGTLTILLKQMHPQTEVIGLDGDITILEIARSKINKAGLKIPLDYGMAFQLPYPDNTFDRVLSSLVIHHLATKDKQRTMREIYRVLRSGGELHIVDFGKPRGAYAHLVSLVTRGMEEAGDNIKGLLPGIIRQAGFMWVQETIQYPTIVGGLSFYRARTLKSPSA